MEKIINSGIKYVQKNVRITLRSRLNNNSHITILVRHISIDSLLNPTKGNNNQNSSSNGSSGAVGDSSNNPNNNNNSSNSNNTPLSPESNNNLPSQPVSDNEDRRDDTDRSEDEDDGYETDSNRSFFEDGTQAMANYPANQIPEDHLRKYIADTGDIVRHPWKAGIQEPDDAVSRERFADRHKELKDELQRRKDEGNIPQSEAAKSECNCSDCGDNTQEGLNSSNTQSGGSGDHGVGTSTTTNNKRSTISETFSSFSNENSPDSFDNFFESGYIFDSSILDFVILYLPYIRIVLLLLPFVFLLKISKLL